MSNLLINMFTVIFLQRIRSWKESSKGRKHTKYVQYGMKKCLYSLTRRASSVYIWNKFWEVRASQLPLVIRHPWIRSVLKLPATLFPSSLSRPSVQNCFHIDWNSSTVKNIYNSCFMFLLPYVDGHVRWDEVKSIKAAIFTAIANQLWNFDFTDEN